MSAPRRFTLVELIVLVAIVSVAATLLALSYRRSYGPRVRTECANNLRQLGLAAIQYGDDHRFLPHFGPATALDGDVDSNHAPTGYRALLWYGYYDLPEVLICPASDDAAAPVQAAARQDRKRWFWGGALQPPVVRPPPPPPWTDGRPDPALEATREVSYGWSRKTLNSNVRGTFPLGADRSRRGGSTGTQPGSVGNHADGWNLVKTDASIEFVRPDDVQFGTLRGAAWLRSAAPGGGYLAVAAEP